MNIAPNYQCSAATDLEMRKMRGQTKDIHIFYIHVADNILRIMGF